MLNTGATDVPTHILVLGAAVVLCSIAGTTLAATNKTKLCFKGSEADPAGHITLTCPENQVITVDEALFGRSKWLLCVISEGDCVDKTKLFQECENRNNCSRSFKTYSTKCGYASVMFISYTCLPVDSVIVYTPTYANVSTTKRSGIFGGSQAHESGKSSGLDNTESGGNLKETGLIAGCVVAAVITVISLVIAITMVVRRLTQKNNPDNDDGDDVETDTEESKKYTSCDCLNCFSQLRNCFSYHENKHGIKAAKLAADAAVVSQTNKHIVANPKLPAEVMGNSLNFADAKGLMTLDNRVINNQSDVEDDQLDSNFNSRVKHTVKENADRNNGSENSPLVTSIQNDINSMSRQQNSTVSDNSFSNTAEDAQEETDISLKRKLNSTADCVGEGQRRPAEDHEQTHSAEHPTYDAVSIPNTEKGTIC